MSDPDVRRELDTIRRRVDAIEKRLDADARERDAALRRTVSEVTAEVQGAFAGAEAHFTATIKTEVSSAVARSLGPVTAKLERLEVRDAEDRELAVRMVAALDKRNALDEAAAALKRDQEIADAVAAARSERRIKVMAIVGTFLGGLIAAIVAAVRSHYARP